MQLCQEHFFLRGWALYKENGWVGGQTFLFRGGGVIKINFEPYIEPDAVLDPILKLDELDELDKLDELDALGKLIKDKLGKLNELDKLDKLNKSN